MKKILMLIVLVGIVLMSVSPVLAADYVGSNACFDCHQENYNYW